MIAKGYNEGSDKVLLANGILPLVSDEAFEENTFLLIRNIRHDDALIFGRQEAYTVTFDGQKPADISIRKYTQKELEKIL